MRGESDPQVDDGSAAVDELPPLPARVGEAEALGDRSPVETVAELLVRTRHLLATLDQDVTHLEADRDKERQRIEAEWERRRVAAEQAVEQLAELKARAEQLAEKKAQTDPFRTALAGTPAPPADARFDDLVTRIEAEIRYAKGITGAIRLPEIGRLLAQAVVVVDRMINRAEATRAKLLDRTDAELHAESTEARASFEIGLGVLQRDLEHLARVLPPAAMAFDDTRWRDWEPPAGPATPVRYGRFVHPELVDAPLPALLDPADFPGLVFDAAAGEAAMVGVPSLLVRFLAACPPGGVRFTLVDPRNLGASVAPLLPLAEVDPLLVSGGVLTGEDEIEQALAGLARHVESVISRYLGDGYPTLHACHVDAGEVLEPYRVVAVFDYPHGLTDRAIELLGSLVEHGPRCGVFTVVANGPGRHRERGLGLLPRITGGPDGCHLDLGAAGPWRFEPDPLPAALAGRILAVTAEGASAFQRSATSLDRVWALVARAGERGLRPDLPALGAPLDPADHTTWWTGDPTARLATPVGRGLGRAPTMLCLDGDRYGTAVVVGPDRHRGEVVRAVVDGLSMAYAPADLDLRLVALGGTRSLDDYPANVPPAARLVAVRAEPELAVAALDALVDEIDRRVAAGRTLGPRAGFAELRGTDAGPRPPRVVAVLDGLDGLETVVDGRVPAPVVDRIRSLLDRIADEGPPLGIHLVLGGAPGDDAVAVAGLLPDTPGVRLLLGDAAGLAAFAPHEQQPDPEAGRPDGGEVPPGRGRGGAETEGVLVPADGSGPAQPFRVVTVDRAERLGLRRGLAERGAAGRAPARVVVGGRPAAFERSPLDRLVGDADRRRDRQAVPLWLGDPVTLGDPVGVDLRRRSGANLLAVGEDDADTCGLLVSAVATALVGGHPATAALVVDASPLDAGFSAAVQCLAPLGDVTVVRRSRLDEVLATAVREVETRHRAEAYAEPPVLVVLHGLDRLVDLDALAGAGSGEGAGLRPLLGTVLRDGPEVGVHVLTSARSVDGLDSKLPRAAQRELGVRVVWPTDEESSAVLVDGPAAARLRPGTALVADETSSRQAVLRPYALPDTDWLEAMAITQSLARRTRAPQAAPAAPRAPAGEQTRPQPRSASA